MSRALVAPFAALLVSLALGACPRPAAPPPAAPAPPPPPDLASAQPRDASAVPVLRLPRTFLPTGYAARLDLDPAQATFAGSISITGKVARPTAVLWLHGHHLTIQRATATRESVEVAVTVTSHDEELLELRAARPLEPGEWTLALDYAGELDQVNTAGAFKQTVDGATYIYTQLEATFARRVFPCFDEPDNKVPWKLTLDVPQAMVAVSNTPIVREAPLAGGKRRVEFAPTRPLPSYLIAFGVGPFEIVDGGKTKGGTPVRVVTLAHRAGDGAYAAQTGARVLEATEEWFGMPYPYEKLDLLTIPLTVGFGAMENAGLVTFTETLMLMDPINSSLERKHLWIQVAAHEIAHQWFGDLVTMAYWDDIWLNEGFANWLQTKTAARFEPAWHDEAAELEQRNAALGADSLVSARQIRQPIEHPGDILNVFDGITYNKGASILRMFETYVGPDVFQRGVRDHLAAHAHGNATSADFAAAISKAAGKDVGPAFATFLEQAGTPELTTTTSCATRPTRTAGAVVQLAQRRYLPAGAPPPPSTRPWIVPVCVTYERGGKRARACTQLEGATGTLALETPSCPRWVMPNTNGTGYYRINYTAQQLSSLRDEAWPELTWSERRAVLFDVGAAAASGRVPLMLALSFVPKLLVGNDRFTVSAALGVPIGFEDWVPAELRGKYEYWLRTTFGPGATQVGLLPHAGDTLDLEVTRSELIRAVAWTARDPGLVGEAVAAADHWRDLPRSIRGLVLQLAVDARPELAARIQRDVVTEVDRARRGEMYAALAAVRDEKVQTAALAMVLDPKLDIRETITLIEGATGEARQATAREFFRAHKTEILARMPEQSTTGDSAAYAYLFTQVCQADQRDAVVAYVTREFAVLSGGKQIVAQAIESMDQCIARRALLVPELRGWLTGVKIPRPGKEPKATATEPKSRSPKAKDAKPKRPKSKRK